MTRDETLRMALEALENLFGTPPTQWGGDVAVWRLGGSFRSQQAIDAIKKALAQPKKEQGEPVNDPAEYDDYDAAVRRNEGKA